MNVNVEEFSIINQLGIKPNPFSESATVDFHLTEASNISVTILNSLGQEVKRVYENMFFSEGSHEFQLENVDAGLYLLKFESENKSRFYKFLKE